MSDDHEKVLNLVRPGPEGAAARSGLRQLARAAGKLAAESALDLDTDEREALQAFRTEQQRIPAPFVPDFRDGWDFAVANHTDVNYTRCDDITRERVRRFLDGEPQVEDTAASVQLEQETVSKLMALFESESGTAMTMDELVSLSIEAFEIMRDGPDDNKIMEDGWTLDLKIARGKAL